VSSSDDKSLIALRNWWTEGAPLMVTLDSGSLSFFGRGELSSFDTDGFGVGFELPVTGMIWLLSVPLEDSDLSSISPDATPLNLIVTVKLGPCKITLAGADLSLRPKGVG
jgi:hypothetical protein